MSSCKDCGYYILLRRGGLGVQRFSEVSLLEALNWCYGLFSCNLNWNLIVLVTDDASLDGTEHLLLILRWIWGKICHWA